jgi:hypothetical protein
MADTLFSTTINAQTNTTNVDLHYTIGGDKKFEHLKSMFIPSHIEYFYPKFKDFIQVFLRYLDHTTMFKTLNLHNNNDLNKIYTEFLDDYLNTYLYDTIDLNKYQLNDENKRLFLLLSKTIHNLKGNVKAFKFLFNSFTNIRAYDDGDIIDIDKITTEFIENESWWDEGIIKYYDATYDYDGIIDHSADFAKPFTYQFLINQSREIMLPLIKSVHPAGFDFEFLITKEFEDQTEPQDILQTDTTYFHYYNYGGGQTDYLYDGTINYAPSRTIQTIF